MRRSLFKNEGKVAASMVMLGVFAVPALVWHFDFAGKKPYWSCFIDLYRRIATFDYEWWVAILLILMPLILFELICTLVWSVRNRSFVWQVVRSKRKPNQPVQPTPGTGAVSNLKSPVRRG
jgi:hypothetical protein